MTGPRGGKGVLLCLVFVFSYPPIPTTTPTRLALLVYCSFSRVLVVFLFSSSPLFLLPPLFRICKDTGLFFFSSCATQRKRC
jgi:hypothetical protein